MWFYLLIPKMDKKWSICKLFFFFYIYHYFTPTWEWFHGIWVIAFQYCFWLMRVDDRVGIWVMASRILHSLSFVWIRQTDTPCMLSFHPRESHQMYLFMQQKVSRPPFFFLFFFFSHGLFLPEDMSIYKGISLEHCVFPHTTFPHKRQWCFLLNIVNVFL
jgi:hypothetical protein